MSGKLFPLLQGQFPVDQAADQLLIIRTILHGVSPPPDRFDETGVEMFPSEAKNTHSLRRARKILDLTVPLSRERTWAISS